MSNRNENLESYLDEWVENLDADLFIEQYLSLNHSFDSIPLKDLLLTDHTEFLEYNTNSMSSSNKDSLNYSCMRSIESLMQVRSKNTESKNSLGRTNIYNIFFTERTISREYHKFSLVNIRESDYDAKSNCSLEVA